MSYGLTSGEPLLINGTVDAPFGEGESARERLRFMDAKLRSSIRAERSSLMEIRLNADLVTNEQMATSQKLLRQFPARAARAGAWKLPNAAKPCSTWATSSKSPPPTSCWPSWNRSSGSGSRCCGRQEGGREDGCRGRL